MCIHIERAIKNLAKKNYHTEVGYHVSYERMADSRYNIEKKILNITVKDTNGNI